MAALDQQSTDVLRRKVQSLEPDAASGWRTAVVVIPPVGRAKMVSAKKISLGKGAGLLWQSSAAERTSSQTS